MPDSAPTGSVPLGNLSLNERNVNVPASTTPSIASHDGTAKPSLSYPSAASASASVPASSASSTAPSASPIWAMEPPKSGKLHVPLAVPMPGCVAAPPPQLSSKENKMYDELLALVSTWTGVPKTAAATDKIHHHLAENGGKTYQNGLDPVNDEDRMFLSRQCLLRYLRAVKFTSVDDAARRLMMTLTWRREYGLPLSAEYISPENTTGKQCVLGFDKAGRPCLYLHPMLQNTKESPRQTQHLVYMLMRLIDLMPPGQEMVTLLVNFKGLKPGGGASVNQAKEVLHILQNHYPERLGHALINDVPWYIKLFFDLISPFIDPRTKEKIKMRPKMLDYIPAQHLIREFGGKLEFEYDHSKYWPALSELCDDRRRLYKSRWVNLGSRIGEDESKLHGAQKAGEA